jgi:transposase
MARIKHLLHNPELRFRWYRQVELEERSVTDTCKIFGISRETYYKWYRWDHPFGLTGKPPRRPHPHTKIQGQVKVELLKAKRLYNFGPKKMSFHLKETTGVHVSSTAIYKFMKKHNLIRKPQKKQIWYTPMKEPYKAKKPGENVQLDVKYVPGGQGEWKYQFRFVDTVTGMQFSRDMWRKEASSTIQAFESAKRSFPFEITGIQTDNGGEFRGIFREYLQKHHIPHRFIPKRSAPWNGKVERANRSVDDEYYLNPNRPWRSIRAYTDWYNHERPHEGRGMNGLTPYKKFLTLSCPQEAKVSGLKVN